LASIGRNSSPQARLQGHNFSSANSATSREKVSLRERAQTQAGSDKEPQLRPSTQVYILSFKREIVLSYILSSGYIGIYEPTYKLLFHKGQGYF
jgi:hypothetical protein